jgi:hypothetical protein
MRFRALGPRLLATSFAVAVVACSPALAKDSDIERPGTCSGASSAKLKLSPENGRIEVEFEVDSNRVGQTWSVRITDNGVQVFAGSRVTQAPSGSFEVGRQATNRAGVDHFVGTARNAATGEVCTGRISL